MTGNEIMCEIITCEHRIINSADFYKDTYLGIASVVCKDHGIGILAYLGPAVWLRIAEMNFCPADTGKRLAYAAAFNVSMCCGL